MKKNQSKKFKVIVELAKIFKLQQFDSLKICAEKNHLYLYFKICQSKVNNKNNLVVQNKKPGGNEIESRIFKQ